MDFFFFFFIMPNEASGGKKHSQTEKKKMETNFLPMKGAKFILCCVHISVG